MTFRHVWWGGVAVGCLLLSSDAVASEKEPTLLQVASGVNVSATSWRGDAGAQGSFEIGIQPTWIGFYFLGRLGPAIVDERLLTYVSAGARFEFELMPDVDLLGRLAVSHQHEETLFVVQEDPAGALFGIGDGIRHRGGGEAALGMKLTVARDEDLAVFVSVEGSAVLFPDTRGPQIYAGLASALGLAYAL